MKKIYYLLGSALMVITVCMIYIAVKGVGLRTEPIIKPSPIDHKLQNIVFGVSRRLFPSFKTHDYVLWGIETDLSTEEGKFFELLKAEHMHQEKNNPNVLKIDDQTEDRDIKNCIKPCWMIVKKNQASDLSQDKLHQRIKNILGDQYFTITVDQFNRNINPPSECEIQKRLTLNCILPISVREVRRFLKEESVRYFFMRRYNEVDYFLFLENKAN